MKYDSECGFSLHVSTSVTKPQYPFYFSVFYIEDGLCIICKDVKSSLLFIMASNYLNIIMVVNIFNYAMILV